MSLPLSTRARTSPPKPRRRLLWLGALFFGAIAGVAAADQAREYQLKAAFLYNFTRFVEWPDNKLPADEPFVIGLWKANPFGNELETTIGDRTAHGRKIVVRTCSSLDEARQTHVLFISAAETTGLKEILAALHAGHVLTVGESRAFARASGIITFVLEGDKLRFEVNLDTRDDANLRMSAQLLKLATCVRR